MEPDNEQQSPPPVVDDDQPPRIPPMGAQGIGALAPMHLSPFSIETNVSRIATQIAEGRNATYD